MILEFLDDINWAGVGASLLAAFAMTTFSRVCIWARARGRASG